MAYLLICAMDLDVPQSVEGSVDVLLDGRLVMTSPIPSTTENHVILPLGNGKQVTLRCTSGSVDYGNVTLPVTDFSTEPKDEWIALDDSSHRLRIMSKYVSEEVAFEECDVDRTFAAQDFLILGLQSLNLELDQQKAAKAAPAVVPPPSRLIRPKMPAKRMLTKAPAERFTGERKTDKETHSLDDLAWEKTEPYRHIISVLEENLASLESVDSDRRDAQQQLTEALAENRLLASKLSELTLSLEEKEAEVEAKWVHELRTEEMQTGEISRELQVVQGMLDATVANRDAAVRQAEARVDDMKSEIARLREELLEVHETSAERYRTLESDLRGRTAAVTILNDENEERQSEWRKELQAEKDTIASLMAEKKTASTEIDVLQGRVTTLEEDLCGKGVNESRLSEARNETRRKQAELDREVAKGEEYRKTMERLVAREQEYSRKFEHREKEMREELERQTELARKQDALNHALTCESHEMAQNMAIMEQRLKLNSGLEDRFAGKNADMRLLQTEQVELQQQFAQEMRLRAAEQDRVLALEERNAVLTAEFTSAQQQQISATAAASSTEYCESLQDELEDVRNELDEQKRANARLRQELDNLSKKRDAPSSNVSKDKVAVEKKGIAYSGMAGRVPSQPRLLSASATSLNPRETCVPKENRRPPSAKHSTKKKVPTHSTADLVELVGKIQHNIAMYVPVKADAVDQALAQLINAYQPPVPFFRVQPGVYFFGSRKVMVKIVSKQLVFRVGGGFCSFQEFVESFAQEELEKMEQDAGSVDLQASLSSMDAGNVSFGMT